jgi:opacity protein-like surface antigen
MRLTIATLALAGMTALPAFAGGPSAPVTEPVVTPAPAPVAVRPDGDWGGFYAGAQLGYADIGSSASGVLDGSGALGGVHAGYRWDLGQPVFGAELDYDWADADLGDDLGSLDNVTRLKLIGGADLGQTFLYATAGAAWADATVGGNGLSDQGWFGGIGADYALSSQWTVGGEVLWHNFDDFDDSGIDIDATTAKVKVSYRF